MIQRLLMARKFLARLLLAGRRVIPFELFFNSPLPNLRPIFMPFLSKRATPPQHTLSHLLFYDCFVVESLSQKTKNIHFAFNFPALPSLNGGEFSHRRTKMPKIFLRGLSLEVIEKCFLLLLSSGTLPNPYYLIPKISWWMNARRRRGKRGARDTQTKSIKIYFICILKFFFQFSSAALPPRARE